MVTGIGIGLGIQHAPNKGGAFNLEAYLATLPAASFWDFTKTDRHFVEATGPTLASNTGDLIGLSMDQAAWSKRTLAEQIAQATECYADSLNPALWNVSGGSALGLTVSKTGTGVDANGSYADYQVAGTASGSGSLDFNGAIGSASRSVAAAGQIWRNFTQAKVVGGTTANVTQLQCALVDETAANAFISLTLSSNMPLDGSLGTGIVYKQASATAGKMRSTPLLYFTAGAVNITIRFYAGISQKLISGYHAVQASGSLKPTRQTTGAKFDGNDDNLLTSYLAGSSGNFIVALVTVPASIASNQIVAGARSTADTRLFLSFSTLGYACGGVGAQNASVIFGSTDRRNTEVVVGISCDGSVVRLFDDNAIAYEQPQSGVVQQSLPLRLGAFNDNGTANGFFGGSIKRLVAGRDHLTLARYQQIRSQLLAA